MKAVSIATATALVALTFGGALAAQAAPDDPAVQRVRGQVYRARAGTERSVMSQGVFRWAQRDAERSAEQSMEQAVGDTVADS